MLGGNTQILTPAVRSAISLRRKPQTLVAVRVINTARNSTDYSYSAVRVKLKQKAVKETSQKQIRKLLNFYESLAVSNKPDIHGKNKHAEYTAKGITLQLLLWLPALSIVLVLRDEMTFCGLNHEGNNCTRRQIRAGVVC